MRHLLTPQYIILLSESRSSHFTQVSCYEHFECEWQAERPRMFLVRYATLSLSFPSQIRLAVISSLYLQINITWNEASFTLPSFAEERLVKACFVAELSCCAPR
jgi:hypothetical protein